MSTDKRLGDLFKEADIIDFDKSSKFILFSDCHRGNNSWTDDFAHNEHLFFHALNYYYKKGFTYIEIGDGDEIWENKKFSNIRNAHSHIFWLLQRFHMEKRFYLIFGNHNIECKNQRYIAKKLSNYYDEREGCNKPLFENIKTYEGLILKHSKISNCKIFLFHGHQGDILCDYLWRLGRFLVRYIWKPLQLIGVKDPTSPAKNFKKRIKTERKIIEWTKSNNKMVICGHTHRPVFTDDNNVFYFNTGSCVHPRCISGIEIVNDNITLIKWCVKTKDDGSLFVAREILLGSKKL